MKKNLNQPYFLFLTLFAIYIIFAIVFSKDEFIGDEHRYVTFSQNLTHGYYSPKNEINLWNGPGYPIILTPFVQFGIDLFYAKILNSILLLTAMIYFYKTAKLYLCERTALISTSLLGLYYPFYLFLPFLLTEIFSIFLVCGFSYHFIRSYSTKTKTQAIIASLFLGFLMLTKVIYAYVILLAGVTFLILLILNRREVKILLFIFLLSIIWCLPYLIYTFNLSGKIYYWSNSGGNSLYWMSTPFPDEYGDWFRSPKDFPQLKANHGQFFDSIYRFNNNIKSDDALQKKAIENIINKPQKYFTNWLANWGRMIFSYPYSYTSQKLSTYFYIPNLILIFVLFLSIYPMIIIRKMIPKELLYILFFTLIYLFLSSLVSAYPRQFVIAIPFILLIVTFVLSHLHIEICSQYKKVTINSK